MADSESYYSDEYDEPYDDEHEKDEGHEENEPPKPAGMFEWILRGGALANSEYSCGTRRLHKLKIDGLTSKFLLHL
jgi:hypothetical protein